MDEITYEEEDIIREIISIGLAKVADSLGHIAGQSVWLHIPKVQIIDIKEVNNALPFKAPSDMVVESDIHGDLNGASFLLISEQQGNTLAEICIGPRHSYTGNYTAMHRSLMLEISNILTGALVTQLANIFSLDLTGMPPHVVPYRQRKSFNELLEGVLMSKPFVMTIKTDFLNTKMTVEIPLLIVLDMTSMHKLLGIIRQRNKEEKNWLVKMN